MYLKSSNPHKRKTFSIESHWTTSAFGLSIQSVNLEEQKMLLIQILNIAIIVNFYDWKY